VRSRGMNEGIMAEKMAIAYFEEKIGEKAFKVCQVPTNYETILGLSGTESFWLIPGQEPQSAAMGAEK
jgi:hypothetical protein